MPDRTYSKLNYAVIPNFPGPDMTERRLLFFVAAYIGQVNRPGLAIEVNCLRRTAASIN